MHKFISAFQAFVCCENFSTLCMKMISRKRKGKNSVRGRIQKFTLQTNIFLFEGIRIICENIIEKSKQESNFSFRYFFYFASVRNFPSI